MIRENIERLKERIAEACSRIGKNPQHIKIVVVTKTAAVDMISEAIECGISDIGENRIQDAILKFAKLESSGLNFSKHFLGHLQTNKVKKALDLFDLIQSVDSLRLAAEINKQAAKIGKIQNILVQVNTSLEASKFGLKCEETPAVIKELSQFKNLKLCGLMTSAPLVEDSANVRP